MKWSEGPEREREEQGGAVQGKGVYQLFLTNFHEFLIGECWETALHEEVGILFRDTL